MGNQIKIDFYQLLKLSLLLELCICNSEMKWNMFYGNEPLPRDVRCILLIETKNGHHWGFRHRGVQLCIKILLDPKDRKKYKQIQIDIEA